LILKLIHTLCYINDMKNINWGIIGLGNIARSFVNDFQYVKGGTILAVASRTISKAEAFCRDFDIKRPYGNYQGLINDKEVDVIYIATPHNLHFQNTLDAIEAGKAVLCEKPITTNPGDLKILMEESKLKGSYLMEAMWMYFLPPIIQAKQWINQGRIGSVKHIKADFAFHAELDPNGRLFNPALAGGALLDIGIYPIALTLLLTGSEPDGIQVTSRKAKTDVDMAETMLFEYKDSLTASLYASFDHDMPNDALIVGSEGYISIPDFFKCKECKLYRSNKIIDHFIDQRKSIGYNYEIDAVHQDLRSGKKESKIMPLSASLQLQKIMKEVKSKFM